MKNIPGSSKYSLLAAAFALVAGCATMGGVSRKAEQAALHETLGFDALIEIEKRTVEKGHGHP